MTFLPQGKGYDNVDIDVLVNNDAKITSVKIIDSAGHILDVDMTHALSSSSIRNSKSHHLEVTGFDVSSLADGKLTLMLETIDAAGNSIKVDSSGLHYSFIKDTTASATDDVDSITEDATQAVTGNVLTNDADASSVTTTGDIAGKYGIFHFNANGSYTYTLDSTNPAVQNLSPSTTLPDTVVYSVVDNHGNVAHASLVMSIHGAIDTPTLTATHELTHFNPVDADAVQHYAQHTTNAIDFLGMGTQNIEKGGKLDLSLADAQKVVTTSGGFGVVTAISDHWHKEDIGVGETLLIHLQGEARSATVTLDNFDSLASGTMSNSNDKAHWIAYDHDGNKIAEGEIVPDADASKNGIINIQASVPFTYIAIESVDNPLSNSANNPGASFFKVQEVESNLIAYDTKIDLTGHLSDTNSGSEVLTYKVIGLDARSGFNHGTLNPDGSWTITEAEAKNLHIHHATDLHLSVEAVATDGSVVASSAPIVLDITHQVVSYELIGGIHRGNTDEDNTHDVSGDLNIDATTPGAHEFKVQHTVTAHGTFDISAQGHWTYHVNNAASQSMGARDSVEEKFNVETNNGVTREVEVSLKGKNDATIFGGTLTGDVKEDVNGQNTAQGQLTYTDVDNDVSKIGMYAHDYHGKYGSLHINANGSWEYTLNNSAASTQALNDGETQHEIFDKLFETIDGRPTGGAIGEINIAVHGTDEGVSASAQVNPAPPVAHVRTANDTPHPITTKEDVVIDSLRISSGGMIAAVDAATALAVTGSVRGVFKDGDLVTLHVNGKEFTGEVHNGDFSIAVPNSDLAADTNLQATIATTGMSGEVLSAQQGMEYQVDVDGTIAAVQLDDAHVQGIAADGAQSSLDELLDTNTDSTSHESQPGQVHEETTPVVLRPEIVEEATPVEKHSSVKHDTPQAVSPDPEPETVDEHDKSRTSSTGSSDDLSGLISTDEPLDLDGAKDTHHDAGTQATDHGADSTDTDSGSVTAEHGSDVQTTTHTDSTDTAADHTDDHKTDQTADEHKAGDTTATHDGAATHDGDSVAAGDVLDSDEDHKVDHLLDSQPEKEPVAAPVSDTDTDTDTAGASDHHASEPPAHVDNSTLDSNLVDTPEDQ